MGVRTVQQLPGQLPLASLREAGLLRAEPLSFLSVLRPDTCLGRKMRLKRQSQAVWCLGKCLSPQGHSQQPRPEALF